ncbi:MAG: hypothetical protein HUU21_32915 [Polyangiaceae bacterium]|nr:hypothetical protein [Polyangiaceae bacterium]
MNEYTRSEEVRSTLIASVLLILCVAVAVLRLVTAQGQLIPDPKAREAAKMAEAKSTQAHACIKEVEKLVGEVEFLKSSVKAANVSVDEADAGPQPKWKPKTRPKDKPDIELAWATAQPTYKQVKALAPCRDIVEATGGVRPAATPAWNAIVEAAALMQPGADKTQQVEAVQKLHALLADAPIEKVQDATREAAATLKTEAEKTKEVADKAVVREPLPEGVFPRRIAVGAGVILCVIALLVSYMSVRGASVRRLATLVPLRDAAKAGQHGLHAAAILKLAGQHNGGEPGIVMGAGFGGLLAALIQPADADLFVAGVMGGLLIGLGIQWGYRILTGASKWRRRATELADIEKPGIPIVLALSSVNTGLEAQFLSFFNEPPQADAAATVEKLASQAEERILAAADAGAVAGAMQQPQAAPPGQPSQPR